MEFGNQASLIEANKEHQYQGWLTGDVAIMYLGSLTILKYTMPHKGTASEMPSKFLGFLKSNNTIQRRE